MIKGAIEEVTAQLVSGWIYSKAAPLRDALILAFSNGICIGTGRIDRFRQDLADAGLDDGYLGFHFPISLPVNADLASVVVRLEDAEAMLLQRNSRVSGAEVGTRARELTGDDMLRRLRWLRRRNIIAGTEYDFLRGLARFGVYEVPLDMTPNSPQSPEEAAATLAKTMLELTVLNEVTVKTERVTDVDSMLQAIRNGADPAGGANHVILWSPVPTRVGIVEGGHLGGNLPTDIAGAVDYHIDPSNLLVLHTACSVVPRPGGVYRSLLVMSGSAGVDIAETAPPRLEPMRSGEETRPLRVPLTRR